MDKIAGPNDSHGAIFCPFYYGGRGNISGCHLILLLFHAIYHAVPYAEHN